MNRPSPLLLVSWSITTIALAVAGAAIYVHQSAPAPVADPVPIAEAPPPPPSAPPPTPPAPLPQAVLAPDAALPDVVAHVVPGVVNISSSHAPARSPYGPPSEGMAGQSLGSGVVVSEDGLVVTNNHVVDGGSNIRVHFADGHEYSATVVGTDELTDVALLRITPPSGEALHLTPVAYGDSSALRLGDTVLAIGNPFGVGQTVTMGIVSAVGRADMGIAEYEDFIQTDASINPGNSGGALVSMRGELVGINTAILSGGGGPGGRGGSVGIGFAIPTAMVRPIVESLLAHGRVTRGWLGVSLDPDELDPDLARAMHATATQGVLVTDVEPGSPADDAGLVRGDIVEQLDTERLTSAAQLRNLVATRGAGAHVQLTFERGGNLRSVPVTLGARPGQRMPPSRPTPTDPRSAPRGGGPPIDPWAVPPSFGVPGAPMFPPGWGGPNAPPGWGSGPNGPAMPSDPRAADPRAVDPRSAPPPVTGMPATVDVGGLSVADLDASSRALFRIPSSLAHGAVVAAVTRGSSGDAAGIDVGDVIIETNGAAIGSAADFQRAYASAGGSAVVLLRRGAGSTYVLMR